MVGGQGHVHRFGQHEGAIEVALLGMRNREIVEGQREIELAAPESRQRLLGLGVGDAEANLGIAPVKDGDGLGQHGRAGAGKAPQAKLSALQARDRRQLALGLVETGDRRFGMREQHPARVGELRALASAVEQLHPSLLLERRDLLADSRLREVERVGCSRERLLQRHLAKDPQALHIKH